MTKHNIVGALALAVALVGCSSPQPASQPEPSVSIRPWVASTPTAAAPSTTPHQRRVGIVVHGGQFCPASVHGEVHRDADGRRYICQRPRGGSAWRWLELPLWRSQQASPPATAG